MRLDERTAISVLKREMVILAAVPAAELLLALVLLFGPEGVALASGRGALLCFVVAVMMLMSTAGVFDRVFDICTRPPENLKQALCGLPRSGGEGRSGLASSGVIAAAMAVYIHRTGDAAVLWGAALAVVFLLVYLAARRRFGSRLERLITALFE